MDFVRQFTVNDVQTAKDTVICLNATDKLSDALKLLITQNILSAPVLTRNDEGQLVVVSVLDMLDLSIFISSKFVDKTDEEHPTIQQQLQNTTAEEVLVSSARNTYWPVPEFANLADVFQILSTHQVHRVPVISSSGVLVSVVSQSAVMRFIWDNISEITFADKTLEELGLNPKSVIVVEERQTALEAFQIIAKNQVSAVAVVDREVQLVGNIGCRDIRCIGPHTTLSLRLGSSVAKFREFMHVEFQAPKTVITATMNNTLKEVIETLVVEGLHRLWIVDKETSKKPLGVLSLRDVLQLVCNNGNI